MTQQLVREVIHRCLTPTPEECPRLYDASIFGKELVCEDPRHKEGQRE